MAVDVLIRLVDGPAGSGRYAGQIISRKQVPHSGWGTSEGPPTYAVVRVTNKDEADIVAFCQRHYEGYRSRYKLKIQQLPQAVQTALEGGYVEVAWTTMGDNLEDVTSV